MKISKIVFRTILRFYLFFDFSIWILRTILQFFVLQDCYGIVGYEIIREDGEAINSMK